MECGGQTGRGFGEEMLGNDERCSLSGLEFFDSEEDKKRHAKIAARAQEMYDEGRPLFTREMIVDAQRQIDELNAGRFPEAGSLTVIGMDSCRYDNMRVLLEHERHKSSKPTMQFNDAYRLTDLTGRAAVYYGNGVTPVQITWARHVVHIDDTLNITTADVAAILDSCIGSVSRTETWQMLEAIISGPDMKRLRVEKVIAFGLGNLTSGAIPGDEHRSSCMQHAVLLLLANLLQEIMGHPVQLVAQDPSYVATCKEVLLARGVEIAEPESGFLLVDEHTLVFTVSCNVPVKQIVTELARPAAIIWGYVEPEHVPRTWTRNEKGVWVFPYTTDHSSPRVREMVKEYTEYLLPEDDACIRNSALYIRKETIDAA
ncbi:hypothetical protein JDV02_004703 [Purpureocillium takamizusanense]|uniref:SRR1-like domain-containing protein n=1 Tax=Purpureocillium takamizusanense TaxID=2060973 RepID=A0A9Q8QGF9_9HYPO|nr:uncharacterized protein JDV02_004703 [Purpureocillium takamizusanense]UNI18434.1 hypothetical protein JDV02_004703 [Purpureocillium takamizusanense]